ncbi:MAG: TonB-dependent receptor [Pedobacter sp.]|uniref:TonB-dependent receptor n=1 Tax=Pedobacter sp. TaxID=1411316 RepID=UPI003564EA6A
MRLIVLILITTVMQVSAETYAQKVTFSKKNASLQEVIKVIEVQTGYNFLLSSELLKEARPIHAELKNVTLKEALNVCFNNQPFNYVINNRTIVVSRKPIPSAPPTQQTIAINGKITDENGLPIPGVSIRIKNASGGTSSNVQGNYNITVPNKEAILIFSSIGYVTIETKVADRKQINISLKQAAQSLDETVVIGYGTVSKKDLTGSVGQVNLEDLNKAPVTTFTQALAGRIAGVSVSSSDGQPGAMQNIVIRGPGSLSQDPSPLYVIDGYPVENFDPSSLNTNEIETINILKDASSAAIYGSRGANGIVIIETKRGMIGKPKLSFNSSFGFQKIRKKIDVMDPYEFVKYQAEFNPGVAKIRYFTNNRDVESYNGVEGINWQDRLFQTSPTQMYDMAIRGGNADTRYSLSGSLFNQKGIIINTGSKRRQARMSLDHNLSKKLRVGVTANYAFTENYGAQAATLAGGATTNSNSIFYPAFGYRPISGREDIDLTRDDLDDQADPNNPNEVRVNPVKQAKNTYLVSGFKSLNANSFLSYNINPYLVLRVTGNISTVDRETESFFSTKTPRGLKIPQNQNGVQASVANFSTETWSNENTLTYNRTFNKKHKINGLLGFSSQKSKSKNYGLSVIKIPNENLGMSGLDEGKPLENIAGSTNSTMASFFGRANYSFNSKYYLTATFRMDGSSKFPPANKWGYFPSGAIAWNISEEDFMKKIKVISAAKLRTSYGITGNNRVGDFSYQQRLAFPATSAYSFENAEPTKGVIISEMGNDKLKWESGHQADIGLDLGFFKNRVELVVDVYRRTTKDMLLFAEKPYATGYPNVFENIGELQNDGLEISINTKNIKTKNFSWESSFNISFNRNKILALTRNQNEMFKNNGFHFSYTESLYLSKVGMPAGMFYGYQWLGNYQYADFNEPSPGVYVLKDDIADNGSGRANVKPGDIKYMDVNGDGTVNDMDKGLMGRSLPIHSGGFNNNFTYKNFDLNLFLQWNYGNTIYNANRLIFEGNGINVYDLNQFASYSNRWTPENQNNTYFRTSGAGPVGRNSTRVLEDGSYLRLKTVSVGYNLPKNIINPLLISNLRVNFSAQNLWTLTNYTGFDPEVAVRNSVLTPGLDYSAYPHTRSFVFGINATF